MRDYRKLVAWEKSHGLAVRVYRETRGFPRSEYSGLRSQMRRAAASVPSNLAEGAGRSGTRDRIRFIRIALGSINELEYQTYLSADLGLLDRKVAGDLQRMTSEIRRMLTGLEPRLASASCPPVRQQRPRPKPPSTQRDPRPRPDAGRR